MGETSHADLKEKNMEIEMELKCARIGKSFLWKVGNNLLPTRKNLTHKNVIDNPICPICHLDEETIIHELWSCPTPSDVWGDDSSPLKKWKTKETDLLELWDKCVNVWKKDELEWAAMIMRKFWIRWNG